MAHLFPKQIRRWRACYQGRNVQMRDSHTVGVPATRDGMCKGTTGTLLARIQM